MGQPRPKPKLLAEKLRVIREHLKHSTLEMAALLELRSSGRISEYELAKREPALRVVLAYAYAGKVPMESIADDRVGIEQFRTQLGTHIIHPNTRELMSTPELIFNPEPASKPKPVTLIKGSI